MYASGKHGATYINKDALYIQTIEISKLCRIISERFKGWEIDTVIGPALGGIVLSQWVTHHLTEMDQRRVNSLYAEKKDDAFAVRESIRDRLWYRNVLIVEDVVNSGGTTRKLVDLVRKQDGKVAAVAALWNRGGLTAADLDVPKLFALVNQPLEQWPPDKCPLCEKSIRINKDLGRG